MFFGSSTSSEHMDSEKELLPTTIIYQIILQHFLILIEQWTCSIANEAYLNWNLLHFIEVLCIIIDETLCMVWGCTILFAPPGKTEEKSLVCAMYADTIVTISLHLGSCLCGKLLWHIYKKSFCWLFGPANHSPYHQTLSFSDWNNTIIPGYSSSRTVKITLECRK